jgi:hypothetical protein
MGEFEEKMKNYSEAMNKHYPNIKLENSKVVQEAVQAMALFLLEEGKQDVNSLIQDRSELIDVCANYIDRATVIRWVREAN